MNRQVHRALALTAVVAGAMLAAGCGTAVPPASRQSTRAAPPTPSLDTSLVTAAGTWAVAVLGGSAARHNNFWQLFGGLVLAAAGQSLITAFRPSQNLTFTPLTETRTAGQAWSALSPVGAAIASAPDALAMDPASGRLLAVLASGTVTQATPGYSTWTTLTSRRVLAATPPGRHCGLKALTAASFTWSRTPLLGGICARPGTAGIFAAAHGTWQAAGPAIPAALARQDITVLRLTRTAQQTVALLAAGSGSAASLVTAWSADNCAHWTLSPPFPLHGAALTSASFGADGTAAVVLTGDQGETITGPAQRWRKLPALPPGTATLAAGPQGAISALAVHRTRLTIWQAFPGRATWTKAQTISVPIQFESSG